jgi:hypothetical protein
MPSDVRDSADMTNALIWTYNSQSPNATSGIVRLFGNPDVWIPELTAGFTNLSVNIGYPLSYGLYDMFRAITVSPLSNILFFWDGAREQLELAEFIYSNSAVIRYHFAPPPSNEVSGIIVSLRTS